MRDDIDVNNKDLPMTNKCDRSMQSMTILRVLSVFRDFVVDKHGSSFFNVVFWQCCTPLTSHLLKTVLYQLCTLLCLIGTVTTGAYAQTIMKLFLGSNNLQPLTIFVIFNYIIASSAKQLFITVPLFPPLQLWLLPQALPLRLWLQPDKQLNNSFIQCSHWTWNDGLIPQMSICVYSI